MQEFTLTHYWMAGIMLVMAIYGAVALVGYSRHEKAKKTRPDSSPES